MKNSLFITLLLIITLNCKAQSPIINIVDYENNDNIELTQDCYLKDVENKFSPFLGTWMWTEGNSELTITIEKLEMVYKPHSNYYSDYLIGKYKYIENGVEIINTLNYTITSPNMWNGAYVPFFTSSYDSDILSRFFFSDYVKGKYANASIELLNYFPAPDGSGGSASQARWKLWDKEHTSINGQPTLPQGFSIPIDVVLTKQ